MRKLGILFVPVALGLAGGCDPSGSARVVGSGHVITQTPNVEAFDAALLVGAFRVEATAGKAASLSITTDDNIMPLITTKVEDGTLIIRLTENVKPSTANAVTITAPSLVRLGVEGAATVTVADVAGSSLELSSAGTGDMTATGQIDNLTIHVSGVGAVDTLGLAAKAVTVSLSGAGSADVHAIDTLDVSLSGLGSVRYTGDPKVTKSVSGLGSVSKK